MNSLVFHPNGTFATGGSDGEVNFWDRINRSRLAHLPLLPLPITAMDFSSDASVLAYCTSYDWSQGYNSFDRESHRPRIYLHEVKYREVHHNR